jgi:hypothetical protein
MEPKKIKRRPLPPREPQCLELVKEIRGQLGPHLRACLAISFAPVAEGGPPMLATHLETRCQCQRCLDMNSLLMLTAVLSFIADYELNYESIRRQAETTVMLTHSDPPSTARH